MPDTPPSESHYSAGLSHSEGAGPGFSTATALSTTAPSSDGPGFSRGTPRPAFGPPFHLTPPMVKSRKAPTILILLGLALCLVALAVVIISVARLIAVSSSLSPIDGTGTTTKRLSADSAYGLYNNSTSTTCTVVGPDGHDVAVTPPSIDMTVNDKRLFGRFTTAASGDYTITCTSFGAAGPLNGGHDVDVYIGDGISPGSFAMTIVGTIISVFIGAAGLSLLIAGLIWFFMRSSSNKKARQAQVAIGQAGAVQS